MNTKTAAGISAIVLALSAGIFSVAAMGNDDAGANANNGRPMMAHMMGGPKWENSQAIQDAIEAGDYNAWLEAVGDRPIANIVTAENFDQFVQMHNLLQEGDKEGAKALAEEFGFDDMGAHFGEFKQGMEKMKGMSSEQMDAVRAAIEAGDYNAWLEAVGENSPMTKYINEDNFARFVEMHDLLDQARAIREELGLPGHHGPRM